jgi:cation diffusion facilitator family transporter
MSYSHANPECVVHRPEEPSRKEYGVLWVILLTFVMMVAEIIAGYLTHSMALLADGWHMATHVGALGITSISYVMARRYARHRAFTFGTGKVHALGGFISALALAAVALSVIVESISRWVVPASIDYAVSIPVAIIGLVVNLASVLLLHEHEHEHDDIGHRAALLHVVADAFTSALAIVALSFGRWAHQNWLDPLTGIIGALVILKWAFGLIRTTGCELLDLAPTTKYEDEIQAFFAARQDLKLLDLHVWCIGRGKMSCIMTVRSSSLSDVAPLRKAILQRFCLAHLTIELHCEQ